MDAVFQEQHAIALRHEKRLRRVRQSLRQERAAIAEAAANRRAIMGGGRPSHVNDEQIDARRYNGADTRSLTGHILGDPIPGDPRCPWRPSSGAAP